MNISHKVTLNSPAFAVGGLAVVLGYMLSTAWITNNARLAYRDPDQRERIAAGTLDQQAKIQQQSEEINRLQSELTKIQNAVSTNRDSVKVINESLQQVKMFAALTEVEGSGITVTLRDASSSLAADVPMEALNIHDRDVLKVVNELWSAGAEAIAVNGLRISVRSCFRCVGPTILVDDNKIGTPVVVQAIGNGEQLKSSLSMAGGIYDELKQSSPNMIEITETTNMTLPAYAGSTNFKFAKAVAPKESKSDKSS
ncbi:MAG: DUF881 domain-containing protein [Armatimonadetes bacterium]|nr:DUF881 domain-containing protein [Armatimonadota bacterium]